MIGAKQLILAGVDSAAVLDEHEDAEAVLRAAGFDPTETTAYAEYNAGNYPSHLIRLTEGGMSYQRALVACFAAAYVEGAIAAARAVRMEQE